MVHKLVLHKGKIQDVTFSHDEKYVATLGGRDDNKLVIWDVVRRPVACLWLLLWPLRLRGRCCDVLPSAVAQPSNARFLSLCG